MVFRLVPCALRRAPFLAPIDKDHPQELEKHLKTGVHGLPIARLNGIRELNETLMLQKSRVLQIQGVKGAAVLAYRKPLTTQEMRCRRLSLWVNNMAVF
jgi:hypothetical protein